MNPRRRAWLRALWAAGMLAPSGAARARTAPAPASPLDDPFDGPVSSERVLSFPRDHGSHPRRRLEWWYATGWLQGPDREPRLGWQITFFRLHTGLDGLGRFAPRQLLIAHAAVSDLVARRHHRAQRVVRWSGDDDQPEAHARRDDTDIVLGAWSLLRGNAGRSAGQPVPPDAPYRARLAAPESGFTLDLRLHPTQPALLQGHLGYSRKGPEPIHASHYYTQPQLAARANVRLSGQAGGQTTELNGRGWLDHEWSDALMPPGAVGWDWIGINLDDGGALTAFVMRDRDDRPLWAAGSHRPAGEPVRAWKAEDVRFTPLRHWRSASTGALYPVHWRIETPLGVFELSALMDDQELDSRASVGAVYWEGLAELRAAGGRGPRLGLGYLEMTGRFSPLRLG
ncbi:MAG: carotenoid 1,2-hydratase [Aquabacterium sp.]|nr:carotenoid 1,2-hydratase [Aquabacterium sp.]